MIRAEELMIGDWVMYNPNVFIEDEYEPTKECFPTKINSGEDIDLAIEDCYIPLPLTPEILEKNGFELKPDGWLWSNEGLEDQNYIFIQFRKGCEGVRNCEINFIHRAQITFKQLYFVHELQHALKLCGIPKNIEL